MKVVGSCMKAIGDFSMTSRNFSELWRCYGNNVCDKWHMDNKQSINSLSLNTQELLTTLQTLQAVFFRATPFGSRVEQSRPD
jgi:hypothetical protein